MTTKKKQRSKIPHTYVILFLLIVIISVLSYIIPASSYDMVEVGDRMVVDPDSFQYIESTPVGLIEFLTAIPRGLDEAAGIVFFIFILGGSFNIIEKTGTMEVGVSQIADKLKDKPNIMIPVFIIGFSILGGTIGMSEETIIFIPMAIILSRNLGFDAMVGTAIVFLGAAVGFVSGFMNSFTVGVAQSIAQLPTFSGMWYRLIIWAVFNVMTIWYVLRYATKVRNNPEESIVRGLELKERAVNVDEIQIQEMTKVQKIISLLFVITIGLLMYGVFQHDFYITEIAALFLALAIISGLVDRMSPNEIAKNFIEGAAGITTGALVVGIARGVLVVLNDGQILYTIVHGISTAISALPASLAAVLMFVFQSFLNFFIPSGSGQAATTMPIMVPLADIVGVTRQTAVLAFQLGDGISNSIIPTGGSLLAALSVANIDYEDWAKFAWPLILIWSAVGAVFVFIATLINYA